MERRGSLVSLLPYWEILEDLVILKDGRAYLGYQIDGASYEALEDADEQVVLLNGIKALLRSSAEAGELFRVMVEHVPGRVEFKKEYEALTRMDGYLGLAGKRQQAFLTNLEAEKILSAFRIYVMVPVGGKRLGYAIPSALVALLADTLGILKTKTHIPYEEESFKELVNSALQKHAVVSGILSAIGFNPRRLTGPEMYRLLWRYFNPNLPEPEKDYRPTFDYVPQKAIKRFPKSHPGQTLRDMLVRSDVDNRYQDKLKVGKTWLAMIRLAGLPIETEFGMLFPLLLKAGKPTWMVLDAVPLNQEKGEGRLRLKLREHYNRTLEASVPDVEAAEGVEEVANYLRYLRRSGDRIYTTNVAFILQAESERELESRVDSFWERAQMVEGNPFYRIHRGLLTPWLEAAPFSGTPLGGGRMYPEVQVAHFFPWQAPWKHRAKKPVEVYLTRLDTPVSIDPFDRGFSNYNALIVGQSGSGKSYLVQNKLVDLLRTGEAIAIAIDRHEYSYHGLYHALAEEGLAEMVKFSLDSDTVFNPFDLPEGMEEPSGEKIDEVFSILRSMVPPTEWSDVRMEDKILLAAIRSFYFRYTEEYQENGVWRKRFNRAASITEFVKTLENLSSIGNRAIEPEERRVASNLAHAFAQWTRETQRGRLFDGPSTFKPKPSTRFVYIVVNPGGNEEFFRVAMLTALITTWNFLREAPVPRKVVVLEEAWHLLKAKESRGLMEELFRRGRTLGIGTWAISQDLRDFGADDIEISRSVLSNINQLYFYPMRGGALSYAREVLPEVPPHLIGLASGLEKGPDFAEVLALLRKEEGWEGGVLRIYADPFRYWTFTTVKEERDRREALAKKTGSVIRAIKQLAGVKQEDFFLEPIKRG